MIIWSVKKSLLIFVVSNNWQSHLFRNELSLCKRVFWHLYSTAIHQPTLSFKKLQSNGIAITTICQDTFAANSFCLVTYPEMTNVLSWLLSFKECSVQLHNIKINVWGFSKKNHTHIKDNLSSLVICEGATKNHPSHHWYELAITGTFLIELLLLV